MAQKLSCKIYQSTLTAAASASGWTLEVKGVQDWNQNGLDPSSSPPPKVLDCQVWKSQLGARAASPHFSSRARTVTPSVIEGGDVAKLCCSSHCTPLMFSSVSSTPESPKMSQCVRGLTRRRLILQYCCTQHPVYKLRERKMAHWTQSGRNLCTVPLISQALFIKLWAQL